MFVIVSSLYLYHGIYFQLICGKESLKDHQKIAADGILYVHHIPRKVENLSIELFTEKEGSDTIKILFIHAEYHI